MSKSTVRKEPTLADYNGDRQGASAASIADEFERFFSENARMITPAQPVQPAATAVQQPVQAPAPSQPAPVVPAYDDPLMAELARIVGPGALARITAPPAAGEPPAARPHDPLAAFEEELRRFDAMHRAQSAPEPAAAEAFAPAPGAYAPEAYASVTAGHDAMAGLEAELARMNRPQPFEAVAAPEVELRGAQGDPINIPPPAPDYAAGPADAYPQDYQEPAPDLAEAAADSRSRKVVMMLSAAAVIAVIGIVGAVVSKGGKKVAGEPPVIAAKSLPMKEKPADPGGAEIPGQDRQVLAKGQEEPAGAPKVVSREEQPVDLAQTPKREVARVILPSSQNAGSQPAAAAPILMPPAAQPAPPAAAQPAPAAPAAAPNAGGFEAKRVRSVRVGADGEPPVAARPVAPAPMTVTGAPMPAPAAAEAAPKPVAAAPTPQRIDPPKSESRPSTAARAVQSGTTPQPARTAARANPPAAPAPAAEQAGENAPMSLRPPAGALATRPVARNTTPSTTASTATAVSSGGGKFAVQLGAPPTQEEAQRMASRLKQQHSSALGGASPGVRAAKVGEKTVYRVRVGGLSREAANTMCGNIKSNGGSCFVASN